jgi:hypothetical protein
VEEQIARARDVVEDTPAEELDNLGPNCFVGRP